MATSLWLSWGIPLLAFTAGMGGLYAGYRHFAPRLEKRLAAERQHWEGNSRDLFLAEAFGRRMVILRYGVGPGLAFLVLIFTGSYVLAFLSAAFFFAVPELTWRRLAGKRRQRLEAQVLDLIQSLIGTTKAGMNLQQGLEEAAARMPPPMCQELDLVLERVRAGQTLENGLKTCEEKVDLPNLSLVLRSILINEQRGGRLTDLLEKLSLSLREIERVEERLKTETAGVELSSKIMAAMPLVVGAIFYTAAPGHVSMLFTTLGGNAILFLVLVLDVLGFSMIRRLGRLEV